MKTLNVGIIGSGNIARSRHAPGWAQVKQTRLDAVCDIDDPKARRFADDFGADHVFVDYGDLLKRKEIDVVSICTHNMLHAKITIDALRAGKHVLVEKPMTTTVRQAIVMVREARKAKRLLMVGQHMRFSHTAVALKNAIDAMGLGEVYFARAQALRRRRLPSQDTFIEMEKSGGGCLYDIGVHVLDLTLHFMGFPEPVSVSGVVRTALAKRTDIRNRWAEWDREKFDVEDFAMGIVRFANGAVLNLESSWLLNKADGEVMQSSVYGTEAGAEWPACVIYGEKNGELLDTKVIPKRNYIAHTREIGEFADAIRNRRRSPVPPEESVRVVAILEALYRSSVTGRDEKIKPIKI